MPTIRCSQVEVFMFRRRAGRVEFLLLRRSADRRRLPGVWQPVTGKIDGAESALAAARREVLEETGLVPRRLWALETPILFFDAATDEVFVLPVFAAEIAAGDSVALSAEHDGHRFVSATAASRLVLWDAQRHALGEIRRQVLSGGLLARTLEIDPR